MGVEPAISADDESNNRLVGRQRQLWLDLLVRGCEEPSILRASRHLLYIARKPRLGSAWKDDYFGIEVCLTRPN